MINGGGDVKERSGLISGHTFLISILAFYCIYKFTNNFKQNGNYKQIIFIVMLFLWIGLVVMARIELKCHQPHQTLIGFVMGAIWAYVVYIVIEKIKKKSSRIEEDEKRILSIFEV